MFELILIVHLLLSLFLIGLVLLQQGKGADLGAAFGGSSSTVFGASGATDLLTKLTTGTAIAFMVTSIFLVRMYSAAPLVSTTTEKRDALEGSLMKDEAAAPQGVAVDEEGAAPDAATAGEAAETTGEAGTVTEEASGVAVDTGATEEAPVAAGGPAAAEGGSSEAATTDAEATEGQ